MVEAKDLDWGKYLNSWKETWGDKGRGMIRFRSINYGYGAVAARTTRICPDSVYREIEEYAAQQGYTEAEMCGLVTAEQMELLRRCDGDLGNAG